MRTLLVFALIIITTSCGSKVKDAQNPVLGTWQLTESLMDIGDGNGTYNKVTSDKTLTFEEDGSVVSNKNVCQGNFYSDANVGTWNAEDQTFASGKCEAQYTVIDDVLEVSYNCIEACGERYVRTN